jgi:hypothetical protein
VTTIGGLLDPVGGVHVVDEDVACMAGMFSALGFNTVGLKFVRTSNLVENGM